MWSWATGRRWLRSVLFFELLVSGKVHKRLEVPKGNDEVETITKAAALLEFSVGALEGPGRRKDP